jgi:hypothetical protein
MNADPKRNPHKGEFDRAKRARKRQEEALDDALKNTFPAPGTAGRAVAHAERIATFDNDGWKHPTAGAMR